MSTSTEINLDNGTRLVIDRPGSADVIRLLWERGEHRSGEPKRNCDLNASDMTLLMALLARDARRVFGNVVAHAIEIVVLRELRTPLP